MIFFEVLLYQISYMSKSGKEVINSDLFQISKNNQPDFCTNYRFHEVKELEYSILTAQNQTLDNNKFKTGLEKLKAITSSLLENFSRLLFGAFLLIMLVLILLVNLHLIMLPNINNKISLKQTCWRTQLPQSQIIQKLTSMYSKYAHSYNYSLSQRPTLYPEDITCIIDPIDRKGGVYIANLQAAQNLNTLKKYHIKSVLTAVRGVYLSHPKDQIQSIKYVPAQDSETFNISQYFDQAVQWIDHNRKSTNVLIHCMAGVSRSVSLLLAYLIRVKQMKYQQAFDYIKRRRPIINPNHGFINQLKSYQKNRKSGCIVRQERKLSPKKIQISKIKLNLSKSPVFKNSNYKNRYSTLHQYQSLRTSDRDYSFNKYQKNNCSPNKDVVSQQDFIQKIQQIKKKYRHRCLHEPVQFQGNSRSKYQKTKQTNGNIYKQNLFEVEQFQNKQFERGSKTERMKTYKFSEYTRPETSIKKYQVDQQYQKGLFY